MRRVRTSNLLYLQSSRGLPCSLTLWLLHFFSLIDKSTVGSSLFHVPDRAINALFWSSLSLPLSRPLSLGRWCTISMVPPLLPPPRPPINQLDPLYTLQLHLKHSGRPEIAFWVDLNFKWASWWMYEVCSHCRCRPDWAEGVMMMLPVSWNSRYPRIKPVRITSLQWKKKPLIFCSKPIKFN